FGVVLSPGAGNATLGFYQRNCWFRRCLAVCIKFVMREGHMKFVFCLALLVVACPVMSPAQTADEIKNAEKTPQNVLTYGMSYSQQRFSSLKQINRETVRRLVPVWSYSMNNNTGEESQPLIYGGVMYVTSQDKTV